MIKLLILNCALFEKLFRLLNIVPTVEFILNTEKPEVIIFPTTFSELYKVAEPKTFNVLRNVDGPVTNKALKVVL